MKLLSEFLRAEPAPSERRQFGIFSLYLLSLTGFGFGLNSPREILQGLYQIMISPDTLVSDYMGIGNAGAAFVNAGLLGFIVLFFFRRCRSPLNGGAIACLFTVVGLGFFGKNIFNIWPIILGVFLYAKTQKAPFSQYVHKAFYGTALAPVVTEILFSSASPPALKIPLALILGVVIGFLLPPIADHTFKTHQGFILYNTGFTAGVMGVVVVALLNAYGFAPIPRMIWTTQNPTVFMTYLIVFFASMIVLGLILEPKAWVNFRRLLRYTGQFPTDFVVLEGLEATLINMGLTGLMMTLYLLWIGADFNGPTIGGVLTVCGFSALGKHPVNTLPILAGVYGATLTQPLDANQPTMVLTALFGTNLAPIAGAYGLFWGMITGFVHCSVVPNVVAGHGGLNLYNNGFAAGIVALLILPIIQRFQSAPKKDI
ncbi:MAG: DUF1576 domain-containing protein [Cyanobacteria bacterium RI_101]|nr:DUF1576 domain-containing protein [Cyanobacteria bacterium RI_101]